MTGPEHYAEAERIVAATTQPDAMNPKRRLLAPGDHRDALALAQVHATLAHTAATVDLFALYGQVGDESKDAWRKAVTP